MANTRYTGTVATTIQALDERRVEPRRTFGARVWTGLVAYLVDSLKAATDGTDINLYGGDNSPGVAGHNHGYGRYGLIRGCIGDAYRLGLNAVTLRLGTGGVIAPATTAELAADPQGTPIDVELFGRQRRQTLFRLDSAGVGGNHDPGYPGYAVGWAQLTDMVPVVDPCRLYEFIAGPGDIATTVEIDVRGLWTETSVTAELQVCNDNAIVAAPRDRAVPNFWAFTAAALLCNDSPVSIPTDETVTLVFENVPCAPGTLNRYKLNPNIDRQDALFDGGLIITGVRIWAERNGT